MNLKKGLAVSIMGALVFPVYMTAQAAEPAAYETIINTTTISASSLISPGRYSCSISQNFNSGMANQLVKSIKTVPGLSKVEARTEDSSIHFTVDHNARVQLSDIQKRVTKVDSRAVVTRPILEDSMTTTPGL